MSDDKDEWVVSWQDTEGRLRVPGTSMVPRTKRKAFDTQKEAFSFAMNLKVAYRGSIQLHMPGGSTPADFPSIKRMHEAQKLADEKARGT